MKLSSDGIDFSYNGHSILSDIHFSVNRWELICLMGENGAGKSTLLKCLNRILKPSKGSVLLDGKNLSGISQNRVAQHMGYVPQHLPESRLTVFESVLMGRKPHIRWALSGSDYRMVETVIEEIGLGHLAMRRLTELSGGERQKVGIARALAQSPSILLLDEPTSNLDLKNQLEVMGFIRRIVDMRGLSAVVAIHDLNIALRFADRFIFLKEQKVHAVSTRDELTEDLIGDVYGVAVSLRRWCGHMVVVPL